MHDEEQEQYRADMTYNGAEFRKYLAAFKEFFDIKTDRAATDKIAEIMQLVLPVQRMETLEEDRELVFRPPVVRRRTEHEDHDGKRSTWEGDVVTV